MGRRRRRHQRQGAKRAGQAAAGAPTGLAFFQGGAGQEESEVGRKKERGAHRQREMCRRGLSILLGRVLCVL